MHTPQRRQKRKTKTQQNAQLTKHDSFFYWSSSSAVCWLSTFRKLGTCSTSEALSPRTVLTENICQTVEQILQHSPAIMPFLTTSTLTNPPMHTPKATRSETQLTKHDAFVYLSSSCPVCWWSTFRKLGRCSSRLVHVRGLLA